MQYLKYSAAIAAILCLSLGGADGAFAKDGKDGEDGATGPIGTQGPQGAPGAAGKDGSDAYVDWDRYNNGLAAVSALHVPHAERNLAVSGSIGGFGSTEGGSVGIGFGIGAAARLNDTWQFGASGAVGADGKAYTGKAVVTGQF